MIAEPPTAPETCVPAPTVRSLPITLGVAVLLVLAACSSASDDRAGGPADGPTSTIATGATADPGGDAQERFAGFVQDLWIYEGLRTVDGEGELIEHREAIVEHLGDLDAEEPITLVEGMTFTATPTLKATVRDADGEDRDDVDAVAGLVENELGVTFAVLATVDADGERQIGVDEHVFVDLTFLGDAIEIGDLAAADYNLVQLLPTSDHDLRGGPRPARPGRPPGRCRTPPVLRRRDR